MTPVFLRPDAELDARAAAVWYDAEDPGLGEDFTDELFATIRRIGALPAQFPT
jgi:toxin ParE1/3/4